jgi:hypothetical protein
MSRIQHLHHHHILEAVIGPHPLMKISAFSEAARPKQRATGSIVYCDIGIQLMDA